MLLRKKEILIGEHKELISFSDPLGRIRNINPIFSDISGFDRKELVGSTYRVINHPKMPSVIFKKMWQTMRSGQKTEAIILNRAKNGQSFWVHSVVEPRLHKHNGVVYGYSAFQRGIDRAVIAEVIPLYEDLIAIQEHEGFKASEAYFERLMMSKSITYNRFLIETLGKTKGKESLLGKFCGICSIYE